jgi:hypothetical protein
MSRNGRFEAVSGPSPVLIRVCCRPGADHCGALHSIASRFAKSFMQALQAIWRVDDLTKQCNVSLEAVLCRNSLLSGCLSLLPSF